MDDLQRLLAIEDIRRTKTRYWNGMDFKDAALLRSSFAHGPVELDYRGDPDAPISNNYFTDGDACARYLHEALAPYASSHQGHSVAVDFVSDTKAGAVWSYSDHFWFKGDDGTQMIPGIGHKYKSWGHYFDVYTRDDAGWRIAATSFRTLHFEQA